MCLYLAQPGRSVHPSWCLPTPSLTHVMFSNICSLKPFTSSSPDSSTHQWTERVCVAWSTVYAPWSIPNGPGVVKGTRMQDLLDCKLPSRSLLRTVYVETWTPAALARSFWRSCCRKLCTTCKNDLNPVLSWCLDPLPTSSMPPSGCTM
jgi:hypothetical protein